MIDSAPDARSPRQQATTRILIRTARRYTAERGLSGFTIEELCSEAAVSRRTFFNYFASKDDAVLGVPLERSDSAAIAAFLATEKPDGVSISPTLIVDLAALNETRWQAMDIAPDTVAELIAAVDQEPRLVKRMLELTAEGEAFDIRLVEQREGLPSGDLRARAAAQIVGSLSRSSAAEFLSQAHTDSFLEIFERHLHAARELFATQTTLIGSTR